MLLEFKKYYLLGLTNLEVTTLEYLVLGFLRLQKLKKIIFVTLLIKQFSHFYRHYKRTIFYLN